MHSIHCYSPLVICQTSVDVVHPIFQNFPRQFVAKFSDVQSVVSFGYSFGKTGQKFLLFGGIFRIGGKSNDDFDVFGQVSWDPRGSSVLMGVDKKYLNCIYWRKILNNRYVKWTKIVWNRRAKVVLNTNKSWLKMMRIRKWNCRIVSGLWQISLNHLLSKKQKKSPE